MCIYKHVYTCTCVGKSCINQAFSKKNIHTAVDIGSLAQYAILLSKAAQLTEHVVYIYKPSQAFQMTTCTCM